MGTEQSRIPDTRKSSTETSEPALTIQVTSGIGFGPTKLAAFDAALRAAGIADFNLITMSSVIPPGSEVIEPEGRATPSGQWGDRLFVVLAQLRVDTRYEEAVAGLGWVQDETTGRGLFVEHIGHTEREVRRDVQATIDSVCAGRPHIDFGEPHLVIQSTVCTGEPTCALVAAVLESDPWRGDQIIDLP